jgi:hypothetical protein
VTINARPEPEPHSAGGADTAMARGTQNTNPANGIFTRLRRCMSTRIAGSKIHLIVHLPDKAAHKVGSGGDDVNA